MLSAIRRSVRYKVMAAILAATVAALLVAAAALLTYEVHNYRDSLISDVTTQAGIVASMSAPALAFDDPEAAAANLALLDTRPDILAAAIYTAHGTLFATYARDSTTVTFPKHVPQEPAEAISGEVLSLFHPVVEDGDFLGTVYVEAYYALQNRIRDVLLILAGVLAMGLLVAGVVSLPLQRSVTGPVLSVADVAHRIIQQRDFTLRARRTTQDEIGVLVDAFNGMLAEVGERQRALEDTNRRLRQETDERRSAEGALRLADQRKDEFLATLAHELRNPLAPMVNALRLLKAPEVESPVRQLAHDIIERQLGHMVRLVEDLLDVSRITRGKLALRMEPTELRSIVDSAVDTVRPLIDSRGQHLQVALPDEQIPLYADGVRVSQVLANLLNNASKYTPQGGQITLRAEQQDAIATVEVSDDGVGIEPGKLEDVFEMFAQGEAAHEQAQTGLGVGLALAKRLVELHGGTIEAFSAGRGEGSTFTVRLPIAAPEQSAVAPPSTEKESGPHCILLVDDNADFAESLRLLLEGLGHEVRVAHDAAQALGVFDEVEPDVAFLDIGLPVVDGYELAGKLRARSKKTIIVALSGWGQEQDRRRSREAGFAMHLVKPVELEHLRAALGTLAAQRDPVIH